MSDYRDMLGMTPASEKTAKPKKMSKREQKRLAALQPVTEEMKRAVVGKLGKKNRLSREVRNLQSGMLGKSRKEEEPVAVVPEFSGRMKKKAKVIKKLVPWEPFYYRSRGEEGPEPKDLLLKHVRPRDDPNRERNVFLRYNEPVALLQYTDEQYASLLASDEWTREQTDELMRLSVAFDARLPVVADRWDSDRWGHRSQEQLKERLFEVQRRLGGGEAFEWEAESTIRRKRHAEILYNRTGHEVWEEYEAQKALEPVEEQLKKAKAANARMRALETALRTGATPGGGGGGGGGGGKTEKKKHEEWSPADVKSKPGPKKKQKGFPRSSMSAQALAAATDQYLHRLKVPIRPSTHPEAAALHAELRSAVMIVLDMDVLLEQKLYQRHVLQLQIDHLRSEKNRTDGAL